MSGYIASTVPARVVRVSGTTLFQVALSEYGDALLWVVIARHNGMTDPWINGEKDLLVPFVVPSGARTGILGL